MTPLEARVRAVATFEEPPYFAAIRGFPPALLSFVRERWHDVRRLLGIWTEGEALIIARTPAWDIVQSMPRVDVVAFVEKHMGFARTTLEIVRRPLGPGEVLFVVTNGEQVSAPRLRFFGDTAPMGRADG